MLRNARPCNRVYKNLVRISGDSLKFFFLCTGTENFRWTFLPLSQITRQYSETKGSGLVGTYVVLCQCVRFPNHPVMGRHFHASVFLGIALMISDHVSVSCFAQAQT